MMPFIALTNSPIVVPSITFNYKVRKISIETAKMLLKRGFVSYIGHQSTADFLNALLYDSDSVVFPNRGTIDEPFEQVVFKLKTRLPEGKILSNEELGKIEYEFWHVLPIFQSL